MGERLFFFWLRFRWLIVVAAFLVAIGGGAAVQLFERADGPGGPETEKPVEIGSTVGSLETGSLLEGCAGLEDGEELFACRTGLPAAMPIILDAGRVSLLGPGGWLNLYGQGVTGVATGIPAEELDSIASGFTADLDNDGYPEHVLVTGEAGDGTLRVLSGVDAATMRDTAEARGLAIRVGTRFVLPHDVDEDGWMDIVVVTNVSSTTGDERGPRWAQIYVNAGWEGPGIFRAADVVRFATAPDAENSPGVLPLGDPVGGAVTDLDADGHIDLVLVDQRSGMVVYWGDGTVAPGEILEPGIFRLPMGVTGIALGDLDADGRTDIVAAYDIGMGTAARTLCLGESNSRPCTVYPGQSPLGGVAVLTQGEGRSFSPNEALSVVDVTYASAVAVLDLDADGRGEILVGREPLEADDLGNLVVYEAVVADGRAVGYAAGDLRLPQGIDPVGRITGTDVDGNGSIDLLLTGRGAKRLQTWVNTDDGARTLRLRIDGSAGFETRGTARGALGAIVTVTDVDDREIRLVVDDAALQNGVVVALPLDGALWSGTEAVPRVEVLFPVTGRRVELRNVATDRVVAVVEPTN